MSSQGKRASLLFLILGALGVVYGDIGTSPLYAINELFFGHGHVTPTVAHVYGAIGLVIYVLTFVVTLKYIAFILLANHEGQGGVFALLGLLSGLKKKIGIIILITILVLAAGLLFGEGIITPAISILSAVEGLSIATSIFNPYIIPITLAVLVLLFSFQFKGTHKVGTIFGPIMVIWFITLALLGLNQIFQQPQIVYALNPVIVWNFLHSLSLTNIFFMLGSVVLAVTGVEALYADMGHFGLVPIRVSWLALVYPALMLNYMGQGAYLLSGNMVVHGNVFYSLVPQAFIYPMVILATLATVIASQALISGAYSLVAQAVALNYLPRFKIVHTNKQHEGQIYVPAVNWLLFIGATLLVLTFKSSDALAAAYGFAVSGVMFTTSLAMLSIASLYWGWGWIKSIILFGAFALVDLLFLTANSLKFFEGGYVPISIGCAFFIIMITWHWGKTRISNAYDSFSEKRTMADLISLKQKLAEGNGVVVDDRGQFVESGRVIIFLVNKPITSPEDNVPVIVRAHMKHNGYIPRYTILLHISKEKRAYIRTNRYVITDFGNNLIACEAKFGFMEDITFPEILTYLDEQTHIPGLKDNKYLIKAGTEEVRIDRVQVSVFFNFCTRLFRLLQTFAAPSYRYFGLSYSSSLSTSSIPVIVTEKGWNIEMPELNIVE